MDESPATVRVWRTSKDVPAAYVSGPDLSSSLGRGSAANYLHVNELLGSLRALVLALALHAGLLAIIWFGSMFAGGTPAASRTPGIIDVTLQMSASDLERVRAALDAADSELQGELPSQRPRQTASVAAGSELSPPVDSPNAQEFGSPALQTAPPTKLQQPATLQELQQTHGTPDESSGAIGEAGRLGGSGGANDAAQFGLDPMLEARYLAAMQAIALANWDSGSVPAGVRCEARFTQIAGGKVVAVEFLDCPYGAESRAAVERALTSTMMPFAGFESVFERHQMETLVFCHPQEACVR